MNIQLLLSASPSQGNGMSASQATGAQSLSSNGLFRQAMLQANEGQPRLPQELATGATSASQASAALKEFASLLESLGIELDQEELATLLAQLHNAEQPSADQLAALPGMLSSTGETSPSSLDEISSRLALVAAFSDATTQSRDVTAETVSIADIAEQLAISQQDAAALVAAYQQLAAGTGSAGDSTLESRNQHIVSLLAANSTAHASSSSQPATYSTLTASAAQMNASQLRVSSEAMTSALAVSNGANDTAARLGSASELALNVPNVHGTPAPAAVPSGTSLPSSIGTPVSHPAWPSQLGQQLVQFAQRGGEQHIQMKLHPAELGPLSISLKMTEHGAQAHFLSAHAQVRQVLEQAIPQLRDALAEQGISLGETSVGEQNASNEQAFAQQGNGGGGLIDGNDVESNGPTATLDSTPVTLDGRVDLYA
ncbi:flagellar hook-length control protein FliK [Vreelandella piezotolerans]|uniref:Flagellar hook-length control protein-like C-terminal domain-containing protein n=1 Tax=Vreelandella piezotolerans TaxID=2609667 RepID=A0ABQ6X9B9_9GAMM|nr:flagellar hook-length control protein FliK [Halomonas piezotolerans]KAE8438613.1 hypothetical protein F1978_09780 [Halomonas piezotolerans]QJA22705.1 hypothetical protein GYM47_00510 [Halomonas piezotolerans]